MKKRNIKSFTISELSIVLIIISFIIGAIMSGNVLVNNSKIKSVISDVNLYKNSVKLFEEKYGSLPGDIAASNIWTGAVSGDENGRIGYGTGSSSDINAEPVNAWQHLMLAKLIYFSNQGILALPPSKIDGAFYILYDQNINNPMYNRVGTYLGLSSIYSSLFFGSAINSKIATQLDIKIDDGLPTSGMVYVTRGDDTNTSCSGSNCQCVNKHWTSATWSSQTSASFNYTDTSTSCRLIFWLNDLQ